ncbi:MAG: hypothetical protein QM733_14840 [Ilumatobacteraceae bacterium]
MTDDARLDGRLHDLARSSLDRHAATVDVDAAFAALTARLGGDDTVPVVSRVRPRRRLWLAGAAAALVVGATLVTVTLARRSTQHHSTGTVPASTASSSTAMPTTAPTSTTTVTPSTQPPVITATAMPAAVDSGATVTITPTATVQRSCGDVVTIRSGDDQHAIGQLDRTGWHLAPSDGTPVTYLACAGTVSAGAVELVVPTELPTGEYTICLTPGTSVDGCAPVTVTAPATPPTTPPTGGVATLDVRSFGVRADSPLPGVVVDELAPNGRRIRTAAEADEATLRAPRASLLPDGSTVTLAALADFPRCNNAPIVHTVDGTAVAAPPQLDAARSLTATTTGLIVATRDICPDGTTWGDAGTHWELVSLDATDPTATVQALQTRLPDPNLVWFDHDGYVLTAGQPSIVSASPDGRYVALIDGYNPDSTRWLLVDLDAPGALTQIPSSCPLAGDIVAEPRFVGSLVVAARQCTWLRDADDPFGQGGQGGQAGLGNGPVEVEAIDLAAGEVVWHSAAAGAGPNGYNRTAFVSARVSEDGTVWAILGADGGVEERTRWFVLHGDDVAEITRDDYVSFAFDPAELTRS